MFKFNKTCWKIFALSSSLCGKNFRSIKDILIFRKSFKDHRFNLSSLEWLPKYILMAATSRICISLIKCLFSIKFDGLCFLWSLVIVVNFMLTEVVWNVWKQFKVQNLNVFGLYMVNFGSLFILHTMFVSNSVF